jgi:hypothetical protein
MVIVISLKEIVGALEMVSNELHIYLNKVTGEIVTISEDDILEYGEKGEKDDLEEWELKVSKLIEEIGTSTDYEELPTSHEINEYGLMESFCYSISDSKIRDTLLYRIRGKGAFRMFKDAIHYFKLEEKWNNYRIEEYKQIAINWLNLKDIAYHDDINR